MKLKDLLKGIDVKKVVDGENREITGLAYDSRKVRDGYLFVALRGRLQDGHNYIKDAVDRGAAAVALDRKDLLVPFDVPKILTADSRKALSAFAAAFYGEPSKHMTVIGVTGTNGKTTTTYLIRSVVEASGRKCGLLGTISYQMGERAITSENTTPESCDVQELLAEMRAGGCTHAVMEISSHGADQGRIAGIHFDTGILTNLASHEHLDYHKTFKEYLRAKLKFFATYLAGSEKSARYGIINIDDRYAGYFIRALRDKKIKCLTYGTHRNADVRLAGGETTGEGSVLRVAADGRTETFTTPMKGRGNVYNALAAVAYGIGAGISPEVIRTGLAALESVPGRFEFIREGQPFDIIVDYAHKHLALANVLRSVRDLKPRRIIVVFGCGGDRDRSKRPLMGGVAAALADIVLITSDNPRSEDPMEIIREIEKGIPFRHRNKYAAIPDRRAAVREAISLARPGDCVLIAGKGHETYQKMKNTIVPFDDREEARKAVREFQLVIPADSKRESR